MEKEVKEILNKNLPETFYKCVVKRPQFIGSGEYLRIEFAPNAKEINRVSGQHPQLVSFMLDLNTLELQTQIYGGMGGGSIYRKPNLNHPKEKYLAMQRVKIPFRKPKQEKKFVLSAIERFCKNYINTLKEHKENLMYSDLVDYSFLY